MKTLFKILLVLALLGAGAAGIGAGGWYLLYGRESGTSYRTAAAGEAKPKPAGAEKDTRERAVVWAQDGKYVRPVNVRIGLSDGAMTEIVKGDLQPGAALVVGENHGGGPEGTTNPFAPQMFRGSKQ